MRSEAEHTLLIATRALPIILGTVQRLTSARGVTPRIYILAMLVSGNFFSIYHPIYILFFYLLYFLFFSIIISHILFF